jgi:hypothetical protein
MVSDLKSETARANGAKSRGPTTADGKEKSSHNAVKHGFTSKSLILLDCESPDEFGEVLDDYFKTHQPSNDAQIGLVNEMVAAHWRIRRIMMIETGMLNAEIQNQGTKSDSNDTGVHMAAAFRALADDSRALALANRYESRLRRIHDRAYKTLRELQHSPSVSEGASTEQPSQPAPQPKVPNEPTAAATNEVRGDSGSEPPVAPLTTPTETA